MGTELEVQSKQKSQAKEQSQQHKKTEEKKDLQDLIFPKFQSLEAEIDYVYGPKKISLDSGKQFDKYIAQAANNRGQEVVEAVSSGTELIMRDIGLTQTTKHEITEREKQRTNVENEFVYQERKKTSLDLDGEEKLRQAPRDYVRLISRQDMAGRNENDGSFHFTKKAKKRQIRRTEEPSEDNTDIATEEEVERYSPHFEDDDN